MVRHCPSVVFVVLVGVDTSTDAAALLLLDSCTILSARLVRVSLWNVVTLVRILGNIVVLQWALVGRRCIWRAILATMFRVFLSLIVMLSRLGFVVAVGAWLTL